MYNHCTIYTSEHCAYCSLMLPPGAGCPFPGAGDTGTGGAAAESCFLVVVVVVVIVIVVVVIVVVISSIENISVKSIS